MLIWKQQDDTSPRRPLSASYSFQGLNCHCSRVTTSTACPSKVIVLSMRVVIGAMATWTGRLPWARLVTTVWYMLTGIWTRPEGTKQRGVGLRHRGSTVTLDAKSWNNQSILWNNSRFACVCSILYRLDDTSALKASPWRLENANITMSHWHFIDWKSNSHIN